MLLKALIAISFYIFGYLSDKCGIGCIICRNRSCILCDKDFWYYQINGQCSKKEIENCLASDNGEVCLNCKTDYYPDPQSGKCVLVNEKVEQCKTYDDSGTCLICTGDRYYLNKACVEIKNKVNNCAEYIGDGKCLNCQQGFFLSSEIISTNSTVTHNSCVPAVDKNCQEQGSILCKQCASGFRFYKNTYLFQLKTMSLSSLRKTSLTIQSKATGSSAFSSCAQANIPNCAAYEEFDRCSRCETGYFVNENYQCELMPEEAIDNCFEYFHAKKCRKCLDDYYMASDTKCSPHAKTIESCQQMSQMTLDICALCVDGYYLTSNKCVLRQSRENCAAYSPTDDLCSLCDNNFILSPDKTRCFPVIENCQDYSFSETLATCKECVPEYFVRPTGICAKVTLQLDGCYRYKYDAVATNNYKCNVCNNMYYMNTSGVCQKHQNFISIYVNCRTTNPTAKDSCLSCASNELLKNATNYCEPVDINKLDEYCNTYNSDSNCTTCQNGYYHDGSKCVQISITNCERVSLTASKLCLQCASSKVENFYPSASRGTTSCLYSYKHITSNCFSANETKIYDSVGSYMNTCTKCYSPNYPEEFKVGQFCVAKSKINYNFSPGNATDNCRIYDVSRTACKACIFNSALNIQMVVNQTYCVNACSPGFTISTYAKDETSAFFSCIPVSPPNCLREENTKCVECERFYLPDVNDGVNIFNKHATYDYLPAKEANHFQSKSFSSSSQFNKIPSFESCTSADSRYGFAIDVTELTTNRYPSTLTQPDYTSGSSIYTLCKGMKGMASGNNKWGCVMCKFGYTGYYIKSEVSTIQIIPRCELNTECDIGVYWEGIGNHNSDTNEYQFFTGCHKCFNNALIPTISKFSRWGNTEYGKSAETPPTNGKYFTQTSCQTPGVFANNNAFPKNCAVQEVDPAQNLIMFSALDATSGNPICIACQPGYKAVVFPGPSKRIKSCDEITNCDKISGLTTFNKCMRCAAGFVLNSSFDGCLPNQIDNCYRGSDRTAGAETCDVCKENYVPSRDKKFCNFVNMENCLRYDLFTFDTNVNSPFLGQGCQNCELGYLAVLFPSSQSLCVRNLQVANRNYTNSGVMNCQIYNGYKTCSKCVIGFTLPFNDPATCIISSTVRNCEVYETKDKCMTCLPGFLMKTGICLDGSMYISNCLVFTSETVCATCRDGFIPMQDSKGTRCYGASLALINCLSFDSALALTGELKCVTCKSYSYPKDISALKLQGCVPIPQIPFCNSYNVTTFECVACFNDYYLQNPTISNGIQRCIKRKNYPYTACAIPDSNADKCAQCIDGYSVRQQTCVYKPSGIGNCDIYSNARTCVKCKNNNYLLANTCRAVPLENLVENCKYYSDEVNCSECDPVYFLTKNTCKPILISNCQVLSSPTECSVCRIGFFLTEIKACTSGKVSNCIQHSSMNECQICDTGFYVDTDKKCSKVLDVNMIPSCKYYATNSTCMLCTDKTILQRDGKQCTDISDSTLGSIRDELDPNCISYIYENNCRVCKGGYIFQNEICQPCNENQRYCHYCDFRDNTKCYVCRSGSHQDVEGKCNLNPGMNIAILDQDNSGNVSVNNTSSNVNSTNKTKTSGAGKNGLWMFMWLALVTWFLDFGHIGLLW
jgi:hypothetical protein